MWRTKFAFIGYLAVGCLFYVTLRIVLDDCLAFTYEGSLLTSSVIRKHKLLNNNNSSVATQCISTNTSPAFTVCTHRPRHDIYISDQLLSSGIWEPAMTSLLQTLLNNSQNATFLDIGANIGYFSLLARAMGHHVVSVEPFAANIDRFERALVLNNFQNKITLLQLAISNIRKYTRMSLSSNNQGAHRLLGTDEFPESRNVTLVRCSYLDDIISFIPTKDVILKIDVEGHECRTLEQSVQLFRYHRVRYILTEWGRMTRFRNIYSVPCPGKAIHSTADMLGGLGYRAFDLRTNEELDLSESEHWTQGDVYWIHKDSPGVSLG